MKYKRLLGIFCLNAVLRLQMHLLHSFSCGWVFEVCNFGVYNFVCLLVFQNLAKCYVSKFPNLYNYWGGGLSFFRFFHSKLLMSMLMKISSTVHRNLAKMLE